MRIKVLNTYVDNLTMKEALCEIDRLIREKPSSYVVTPNLDHIVTLENDALFKEIYDNADLVLADGKPLVWWAKGKGTPLKEKISGADLFPKLCQLASKRGYRVFILGAAEGVAEKAANSLKRKYDRLKIVGTYSPPMGFENNQTEIDLIINKINNAQADILAVALGSPKGEKLIWKMREKLTVPLSISIGATIDFEAGIKKRAPRWMSEAGFEWFYRTLQEPARLSKRYLYDMVAIIPLLWKYRRD